MKRTLLTAIIALVLMAAALASAEIMRPTVKLADIGPRMDLEAVIPEQFGQWRVDRQVLMPIVNPQQQENIERIYAQTLSRVYVDGAGRRVMLAIAYGEDQRDSLQAHTPDVCYPAQGFSIESGRGAELKTRYGVIPVKQRVARLASRWEPITYWTTIGDEVVRSGLQKKTVELRYGLKREIPDGLLFRVSSIDADADEAFALQRGFIDELLAALAPQDRVRLAGLGGTP